MQEKDIEIFYPTSQSEWRQWLQQNHLSKQSVWLIQYKKKSNIPTISWSDAVDEALCFGWIDSVKKSIDDEKTMQFFSRRKPKGTWSKINKEKVKRLIDEGLMSKAGLDVIEKAKENGSWTILDEVEELIIPADLEEAFKTRPDAREFFLSLSKSRRKFLLYWIVAAKRQETREKRIMEIVELTGKKQKPKQF